ncbi:MAG: rod shape-determining protein MreD [Eubacteriales bacterium]
MRYIVLLILFVTSLVLPGTVFYYWSWAGIKPDLAMLLIIYIALHYRPAQGVAIGFVTGLLVDMFYGRNIGMYTIALTVVALLSAVLQKSWYRENIPLTTFLVFIVTLVGQLVIAFLGAIAGLNWYVGDIVQIVLGVSFYNALLVPLTYPLIHGSFTSGVLKERTKYEK